MFACLMLNFFRPMRECALDALGPSTRGRVSGQFLQSQLLLREDDCRDYLTWMGFSPDQGCNIEGRRNAGAAKPDKFHQQDLWILDEMRAKSKDRLRRDFVKYGLALAGRVK